MDVLANLIADNLESFAISDQARLDLESLSLLESLPCEIILKIVEHAPEIAFDLRQTSRMLRTRVEQYIFEERKRMKSCNKPIEIVQELRVSSRFEEGSNRVYLDISMDVSKIMFNLRLLLFGPYNLNSRIERSTAQGDLIHYKFTFIDSIDDNELLENLRKFIGNRFKKVVIAVEEAAMVSVSKLLRGTRFGEMQFTIDVLSTSLARFLLSMVRKREVNKVTLKIGKVGEPVHPADILFGLSSLVRSLKVEQSKVEGVYCRSNYFLGWYRMDWAPVIVRMFSRKLDKLSIDNAEYPEFLPKKSWNTLKLQIANNEKKLWFATSPSDHTDYDILTNGYLTQFKSFDDRESFMIVHESRANEEF